MAARNDKHRHNELAARIITELRRYGLPQARVSEFLGWLQDEKILDIGKQGYSVDTLQRHYKLSMAMGDLPNKHMLMQIVASAAMGEALPEGVNVDNAYRIAIDTAKWTLEKVHGVGAKETGADGGDAIPIELIGEILDQDELLQLERIMVKLQKAKKPGEALIEHGA